MKIEQFTRGLVDGWPSEIRRGGGSVVVNADGTISAVGNTDITGTLDVSGLITASAGVLYGTTVTLTEGAANRLDLASGDSFNIVSGNLTVGGQIVVTSTGPNVVGSASTNPRFGFHFAGTYTKTGGGTDAAGVLIGSTIVGIAGDTGHLSNLRVAGTITTQTATENIGVISAARFERPFINDNLTGDILVAATVFILNAPTVGETNAALYVKAGDVMTEAGMFTMKEITTPSAIADWGRIYTKTDDKLYFQDGAGVEHTFSVADYAAIRFDDNSTAETIDLTDLYHLVTRFATNGLDEVSTADQANNRLTIGASRDYNVALCGSAQAAGGSKVFVFDVFEISQSTANITAITQATPGVVTAAGHGFSNGDLCKITGVVGMTEVNDKIYKVAGVSGADFDLQDDEGVSIATGGFGAWSSGGTVALATKTFAHSDRTFSNASGFGAFGSHWYYLATSGDAMEFYIKNKSDATDITFEHLNLTVKAL